ncbi:MAG: LysR family transcriptional regulator [Geminicoccaceae bacterium]
MDQIRYCLAVCETLNFTRAAEQYRSEPEDWIQTMVMAGIGIAFMPQYSIVLPGLPTRPLVDPEVVREVSLVTVAGRRFSPAVAAFVRAIKSYPWSSAAGEPA